MEDKQSKNNKILIVLILSVIFIWGGSALLIFTYIPESSERGTFRDLFGAVNALFSALAFAALIYTIILQRQEIKENKEEIVLNRKGLEKGA